jgi:hypothetical protein
MFDALDAMLAAALRPTTGKGGSRGAALPVGAPGPTRGS